MEAISNIQFPLNDRLDSPIFGHSHYVAIQAPCSGQMIQDVGRETAFIGGSLLLATVYGKRSALQMSSGLVISFG